jgi:hypothetical protein
MVSTLKSLLARNQALKTLVCLGKLPAARLPQAWFILLGPAEAGGATGSIKVIYGEYPASVRRVSGYHKRCCLYN